MKATILKKAAGINTVSGKATDCSKSNFDNDSNAVSGISLAETARGYWA